MRQTPVHSVSSILEGTDPSTLNTNGIRPIFSLSAYNMEIAKAEFKLDKYRFDFYNLMLGWEWDNNIPTRQHAKSIIPRIAVAMRKAEQGSYRRYLLESIVWELGLVLP